MIKKLMVGTQFTDFLGENASVTVIFVVQFLICTTMYVLDVLGVNQSSLFKLFLLQNFMNIHRRTFFSKLFPWVSEGPQKPHTLTDSKVKSEKFGQKFKFLIENWVFWCSKYNYKAS